MTGFCESNYTKLNHRTLWLGIATDLTIVINICFVLHSECLLQHIF